MVCNSCGREQLKEDSNFCVHCGASHNHNIEHHSKYNTITNNAVVINQSNDGEMSYLKWLGTLLIPFIPMVGTLAFFIMVIVWAVTKTTNPSKSNWAKAYLLYSLVAIVFTVLILFVFVLIIAVMIEGMYY